MMTLTGDPTYTVVTPAGSTTYQQGEAIREDHFALVPRKDQKLFTEAPASITVVTAEAEAPKAVAKSLKTQK